MRYCTEKGQDSCFKTLDFFFFVPEKCNLRTAVIFILEYDADLIPRFRLLSPRVFFIFEADNFRFQRDASLCADILI